RDPSRARTKVARAKYPRARPIAARTARTQASRPRRRRRVADAGTRRAPAPSPRRAATSNRRDQSTQSHGGKLVKKVSEVMTRDIHIAAPDQTLAEAA